MLEGKRETNAIDSIPGMTICAVVSLCTCVYDCHLIVQCVSISPFFCEVTSLLYPCGNVETAPHTFMFCPLFHFTFNHSRCGLVDMYLCMCCAYVRTYVRIQCCNFGNGYVVRIHHKCSPYLIVYEGCIGST